MLYSTLLVAGWDASVIKGLHAKAKAFTAVVKDVQVVGSISTFEIQLDMRDGRQDELRSALTDNPSSAYVFITEILYNVERPMIQHIRPRWGKDAE